MVVAPSNYSPTVEVPRPLSLWRNVEDGRIVQVVKLHNDGFPGYPDLVTVQWGYKKANTWDERLDTFFSRYRHEAGD